MSQASPTSPGAAAGAAPWWQRTTVYQIYPRSFFDSNGDGIGDLPGILSKLDYLVELGVETLWLSPFWQSPQQDFGYDISDHYRIAPEYGTLDDCQRLLDGAHRRGLRIVLDMVLNHTSIEHAWFRESRKSRNNPYRDHYIWRPGRKRRLGGDAPPNNWRSLIGPGGWHHDPTTDEWYFASFLPFQPDLNYRNPAVQQAMLDVVRHWLWQGFDGLRLDIFNCLFKDAAFPSNPLSLRPLPSEDNPDGFFQSFRHSVNHPDTFAFARTLRQAVDQLPGPPRFLVGEVFGAPSILRRYCTSASHGSAEPSDGLHLVFLFKSLRTPLTAPAFRALIAEFEREFPAPLLPTYVFGNHDRPRASEHAGNDPDRERLRATLQLTVRGVPFIYYGEELGMQNLDLPMRTALDPLAASYRFLPDAAARFLRRRGMLLNRDECRGPMQWSRAPHAGFTSPDATPWLPTHPLAPRCNVAVEQADSSSLYSCYRRLLALRAQTPALHSGALALHVSEVLPQSILGYRRTHGGQAVDVLLNFSAESQQVDIPGHQPRLLFSTHRQAGSALSRSDILAPYEAIVTEPA